MSDTKVFKLSFDSKNRTQTALILQKYGIAYKNSLPSGTDALIWDLDRRIEKPAKVSMIAMIVIGILTFGGGLSMVLTANLYYTGSLVGVLGFAIIAMAFAVKDRMLKRCHRRNRVLMEDLVAYPNIKNS